MTSPRLLAIAAASGRVGYVCFSHGQLKEWRISNSAATSVAHAETLAKKWINELIPDVVVTQTVDKNIRKGAKTIDIILAISKVAEKCPLLDVQVSHHHDFANKYDEAVDLARRYPDINAWVPNKRRFFDNEPRNTVLFEALSLADSVLRDPATAMM